MITKARLDDVIKRINRILTAECGESIPFVLVIVETMVDPQHGPGLALRCTGNTHEEMVRDMLVKAATHVLETEYEPPQLPENLQ